jgi:hypothetical protein
VQGPAEPTPLPILCLVVVTLFNQDLGINIDSLRQRIGSISISQQAGPYQNSSFSVRATTSSNRRTIN